MTSLVAAIDLGTSSTRVLLFDAVTGRALLQHQIEVDAIVPRAGWAEVAPRKMLDTTITCIDAVCAQLHSIGRTVVDIKCVGITNHRGTPYPNNCAFIEESIVAWSASTGAPLANCVLWLDARTAELADTFVARTPTKDKAHFATITGLPIHPYFSALKIRWLIDNVLAVREALNSGGIGCRFSAIELQAMLASARPTRICCGSSAAVACTPPM